ncbi:hypothetical protein B0H14DRAFT_3466492 [Mycena olivaceomarginata]|nr:hypothetical protein B0H14DRAFT_3466492 [Mycena olivaceomarginata]
MISPSSTTNTAPAAEEVELPGEMFAPVTPSKSPVKAKAKSQFYGSKTLLTCDDKVPVYDARKVVINFDVDLGRLDKVLPLFAGEVPSGSFVVVGYTVSWVQGGCSDWC